MIAWGDVLFVIIAIAELAIDFSHPHTIRCVKHKGLHIVLFLVFHHLIASFMMYGWLLPNKKLLFLFIIGNIMMLMEWIVNRRCRLTVYANNMCQWKSNTPFRDLVWWLGLKDVRVGGINMHGVLAVGFLLLGIYLYRRKG
jgi:hypothetical protein